MTVDSDVRVVNTSISNVAVSYRPILPPVWAALPTDPHLYERPVASPSVPDRILLGVTIMVRTPALCLLDTLDKSFSLCLPYSSLTLCLICTDNLTSLSIPFLVRYLCSIYDSFLITNTVVTFVH